jgi:hypothetical protein
VKAPPPVTATPLLVGDATALAVVGLSPRQFRAFVREHAIPRVRVGRRTLVRADELLAVFDRLAGASPRAAAPAMNEAEVVAAAAAGGTR